MTWQRICLLLGGISAAVGLLVGFMPLRAEGASCGTAFVGSDDAYVQDLTNSMTGFGGMGAAAACDSLRHVVIIPAVAFLVIAAILVGVVVHVRTSSPGKGQS